MKISGKIAYGKGKSNDEKCIYYTPDRLFPSLARIKLCPCDLFLILLLPIFIQIEITATMRAERRGI